MRYSDPIRTLETAKFRVILDCTPETDPDFSFDDSGETQEKVNSGEWSCVEFRVRVIHKKTGLVLGEDHCGNSIYANPADFAKEHIGAAGRWGSYFRDLISDAIAEARDTLETLQTA
jgi:hypothetical protein